MTFTSVYYEASEIEAQQRLNTIRNIDKYPEIKAYILQEGNNSFRVLRKIKVTTNSTHKK